MTFDKHFQWYKGWKRVLVHLLFWVMVFIYEGVQTSFTIPFDNILFIPVTLREVVSIAFLYYFLMYYCVPRFLLKKRWFFFILCLIIAYVFMSASTYYSLQFLKTFNAVPPKLRNLVDFYTQHGFLATLIDPVRIYNLMLFYISLFFAVQIKVTKELFRSTIQKLFLEKENLNLEKENIQLELNFLKSQVNPHFFFNTFNNIYALIVDKDEIAADIIVKLSGLMRYTLYESSSVTIPLKKEIEFINDYVYLEKIRHKKHVNIKLDVLGDPGDFMIPPLIMITFVENAFKHGVNNTIEASWVNILVNIHDHELQFEISNSKPSKLIKEKTQGGIGVVNAKRRLDLLYPDSYDLDIRNNPDRYDVKLQLHLYESEPQLHYN